VLWWAFHTVVGLMVVVVVVVLVLVVMYKLWAQEQQLAAAESNANLCGSTELRRLGCCR
jgi:ABC-type protease/lipase transport system fused ATPase/permease subunit